MKAIVFEMSDCGVWYAEIRIEAKDFHSFRKTGSCCIRTHIAQTIWFPLGSVAEVLCGDRAMFGAVTEVRCCKTPGTIEVTLRAMDESGFDAALDGRFLCGYDLN